MAMRIFGGKYRRTRCPIRATSSPSAACCTPGPTRTTAAAGRSEWLDIDWHRHQHRMRDRRARGQLRRRSARARALVFVHGLGASWQSWLENIPEFARDHRVVAMDLPGFGYSELPDERHLDRVLRELDLPPARRARDRRRRGGRQLDGRLHRRRDGDPQPRARAAPRGRLRRRVLAELPPRPAARRGSRGCRTRYVARALTRVDRRRSRRGRACASWALATAGFRYPHLIAPELAHEMVRSARRTDGFLPALEALADYPLEEELPKISCPTLIVWGAHDTLVPVKDAKRMRGADPGLAARGLRAHRPRRDARAPRALQPAAARVPRRARPTPRDGRRTPSAASA